MQLPDKDQLPTYIDPAIDLRAVREECQKLVKSRAKLSAGAAVIPVPMLDVAVDAGMLAKLLPEITERFGLIDDAKNAGKIDSKDRRFASFKDSIFGFGGLVAARGIAKKTIQGFGGRILSKQITKFVPFGGQMVSATMGYMIFKKIAFEHIEQCYNLAKEIQDQSRVRTPVRESDGISANQNHARHS